jgi:formate C-acetyltransferase
MGMKDFRAKIKASMDSLDFYNDPQALAKREELQAMQIAADAFGQDGKSQRL